VRRDSLVDGRELFCLVTSPSLAVLATLSVMGIVMTSYEVMDGSVLTA